ncbi:MAG: type II secretion system protein, partial [Armatimonadota bacterium]
MRAGKGFTLIELLVVIAIIAVLAAMLFPVFVKVRVNAYASKCLAHGRQLGQAMMLYLDDYSGRFPSAATDEMRAEFANYKWTWSWRDKTWTWGVVPLNEFKFIQLKKYVKSQDIWICPYPSGPYGMKYAYGYRCSWFFFGGPLVRYAVNYPDTGFTEPDASGRLIGRVLTEVL